MPLVGFETTISAGERPQTYTLERAATGTGKMLTCASRNPFRWSLGHILYHWR